jgi:hypothetical protein
MWLSGLLPVWLRLEQGASFARRNLPEKGVLMK